MVTPRYLIGGGEKLSLDVERPARGMGEKAHPYTFGEAKIRLAKPFRQVGNALRQLPTLACPNGDAALAFTLHPSYLAKSYYPSALMQELGLRHLGSRAVHISPTKAVGKHSPDAEQPAPLFYLAGSAEGLKDFSTRVSDWNPQDEKVRENFRQIEMVELPGPDRLKPIPKLKGRTEIPLEVVLHADIEGSHSIAAAFSRYIKSIGLRVDIDRRRQVGGLLFVPMHAPREKLDEIIDFTFLRALRQMPRVKPLDPMIRGLSPGFSVTLGIDAAVAPELSAAIFDGG